MPFPRFELASDLFQQHDGNSIRFDQSGNDLIVVVRLKIRTVDPYPGESSSNQMIKALAESRRENNTRQPLDDTTHNYLAGTCDVEIRKNDLTDQNPGSTLIIKAVIDPKVPRTGPSVRLDSEITLEEFAKRLES